MVLVNSMIRSKPYIIIGKIPCGENFVFAHVWYEEEYKETVFLNIPSICVLHLCTGVW